MPRCRSWRTNWASRPAEGIAIQPVRDLTWATVRDRLLYGHTDAAHLVAPLAIATTLGRGRPAVPLAVPFVLGLNGNAITLSTALGEACGLGAGLGDPVTLGAALKRVAAARRAAGDRYAWAWCIAIPATTICSATGWRRSASARTRMS